MCDAGRCRTVEISGCVACQSAIDCSDGSGCTVDTCDGGICRRADVPACMPCVDAIDCDDANPCTTDMCVGEGVCQHAEMPACALCTSARDCNDGDPCTRDACGSDGSCQLTEIPGCVPCDIAADCEDGNICTREICSEGVCRHEIRTACAQCLPGIEICGDGVDNDCDGVMDCADPSCSAAPGCEAGGDDAEICGDCQDNDGDGLVDYEDPDCCGEMLHLELRSLKLRTRGTVYRSRKRFRMRAMYAPFTWGDFDPTRQDTSVQISDDLGPVFCTTVEHEHWKPRRQVHVAFRDRRMEFAGGLRDGRFSARHDGSIRFKTRGPISTLRVPRSQDVRITVRVGDRCSTMRGALHAQGKKLRYP